MGRGSAAGGVDGWTPRWRPVHYASIFTVKLLAIYTRHLEVPGDSFFLFGPRGTGKSTWLRQRLPDALWFDLLRMPLVLELTRNPEAFRARVEAQPKGTWVVLDEVQRMPQLLDEVHALIAEHGKRYRFALSGSSARKLRRLEANLLAEGSRHVADQSRESADAVGERPHPADDDLVVKAVREILVAAGEALEILDVLGESRQAGVGPLAESREHRGQRSGEDDVRGPQFLVEGGDPVRQINLGAAELQQ